MASPSAFENYEIRLTCPGCGQTGTVVFSGWPPATIKRLPPQFRIAVEGAHSEDGKPKVRCRCDQLLEL